MEWLVLGCGFQGSGSDTVTTTSEATTERWASGVAWGIRSDVIVIFIAVNYCHTPIHNQLPS